MSAVCPGNRRCCTCGTWAPGQVRTRWPTAGLRQTRGEPEVRLLTASGGWGGRPQRQKESTDVGGEDGVLNADVYKPLNDV